MTTAEPEVLRLRDLERFNLAPDARSFDCKFIEPGIISYRDHEDGGIELLRKETIDACIASAIGNAVTHGHVMVTPENRLNVEEGIVQDWYYDAASGWYHVKGVATTQRAKTLMPIKRPSCGYYVTSFGPGGTYHGIRYDREITGIKFNHLAIVDKPRYEGAVFRLNTLVNSMNIIKLLKKIVTRENGADGNPVDSEKTETIELPAASTEVQLPDGKMVRLNDLFDVWMKQTSAAVTAPSRVNGDDEVDVDGKKVKVNELVDCYRKNAVRANEAPETEAPATEEAAPAPGKQAFFTLSAARQNGNPQVPTSPDSGSLRDRCKRAEGRY